MVLIQTGPREDPNYDSRQSGNQNPQKPVVNRQQKKEPCPHPQAHSVE